VTQDEMELDIFPNLLRFQLDWSGIEDLFDPENSSRSNSPRVLCHSKKETCVCNLQIICPRIEEE
jgi:hypothetical protein